MSLRKAINAKCRQCTYDSLDKGSAAVQVACCISTDCALHAVRPITCKSIPWHLLEHWYLKELDLCDRARPLVETSTSCSVDGQIEPLLDVTDESNARILVNGHGVVGGAV